jgi:single-strand selective monofunctional uracil DNA glycosylase
VATAASDLVGLMERLKSRVKRLRFGPPVAYVYNPLDYAWPVARAYFERYGKAPKEVLFVGMNPGPFGMGQTGVPFGEVAAVRDFLRLEGEVKSPRKTHEKRPVEGFGCARSEISGQRLWGAIAKQHMTPEKFFERGFILNYCPLLFLGDTGINLTPDKLAKEDRKKMEAVCDAALGETIRILAPAHIVGVGQYAAKRCSLVVGEEREVITMPHPSPANPKANRSWEKDARKALHNAGLPDLL